MHPRDLATSPRRAWAWPLALALVGCTGAAPGRDASPAPAPALPRVDVAAAVKVAEALRLVEPSLRP